MAPEENWPNPSWCMELVIETENEIDIEDVLNKVHCLHKTGVGYAWGYEGSPHTVSLHANKPKFLSLQLFKQAKLKIGSNKSVLNVTETRVKNLFHENNRPT